MNAHETFPIPVYLQGTITHMTYEERMSIVRQRYLHWITLPVENFGLTLS